MNESDIQIVRPGQLKAEERRSLRAMTNDPVLFAQGVLRHKIWDAPLADASQSSMLRALRDNDLVAVKAAHGVSKTFTAAEATLWWIVKYRDGIVLTTSPTGRQVEALLWGEIRKTLAQQPPPTLLFPPPNLAKITLGEGNYAMGFATSPENAGVNIAGFHGANLLIIIDEATGVQGPIWDALEGARAGGRVKILVLCNPVVPQGPVYDIFTIDRLRWKCMTIDALATPNLTNGSPRNIEIILKQLDSLPKGLKEDEHEIFQYKPWPELVGRFWVYEQLKRWGVKSAFWQARVRGQFPDQGEDSAYPLSWLERAKTPRVAYDSAEGEVEVGVDVAGPGKDNTVVTVRCGSDVIAQKSWPDPDPRGEVAQFLGPYRPRCGVVSVDSGGIGHYFAHHLVDLGYRVIFINFGAASMTHDMPDSSLRFKIIKAELYWKVRELLEADALHGLDEKMVQQATQVRYMLDPEGRIMIEPKEKARKRGIRSPDEWESLLLAFAGNAVSQGVALKIETIKRNNLRNGSPSDPDGHAGIQVTTGSRFRNIKGAW